MRQVADVGGALDVVGDHVGDPPAAARRLVQVAARHRPLERDGGAAGVEVAAAEVVVGVPGVGGQGQEDRRRRRAHPAGGRRRRRGPGGACRRRRSRGPPRSSRCATSDRRSAPARRASRSRSGRRRAASGGHRRAPPSSLNTTVRSSPTRATSTRTGRPAGRRQVQPHRLPRLGRLRPAVPRHRLERHGPGRYRLPARSVGEPVAVEPDRHPGGEQDPGHRTGAGLLGGQDHELAAVGVGVVHEA